MESKKETCLRILESAKDRCAMAVKDGDMTVQEYEEATGRDGGRMLEQVKESVKAELRSAGEALKEQGLETAKRAYQRLEALGAEEKDIRGVVGDVTVQDGVVTAPDWKKLLGEAGE